MSRNSNSFSKKFVSIYGHSIVDSVVNQTDAGEVIVYSGVLNFTTSSFGSVVIEDDTDMSIWCDGAQSSRGLTADLTAVSLVSSMVRSG